MGCLCEVCLLVGYPDSFSLGQDPDQTDPGSRSDRSRIQIRRIQDPDQTDPGSRSDGSRIQIRWIQDPDQTDPGSSIAGTDGHDPGQDAGETLEKILDLR